MLTKDLTISITTNLTTGLVEDPEDNYYLFQSEDLFDFQDGEQFEFN